MVKAENTATTVTTATSSHHIQNKMLPTERRQYLLKPMTERVVELTV